jgi:hypothetical protein
MAANEVRDVSVKLELLIKAALKLRADPSSRIPIEPSASGPADTP